MPDSGNFSILVDKGKAGKRLDTVVSSALKDCSRSFAAVLIRQNNIRVLHQPKKPGYRVKTGDLIEGHIPSPEPLPFEPEPIPIDILFEDECLIVVNKPPGLVVHPAPGHVRGTLVNGLLHHCPDLKGIGGKQRPGIVHRLDKDTSGVLVVAKTDNAHHNLSAQFKSRRVKKKYLALVFGPMPKDSGKITLPVGRHPIDRKKMSTLSPKGRIAETHWHVKETFGKIILLEVNLMTGRTHQIRVHCAAIDHPVIGDPVYFKRQVQKELQKDPHLAPLLKSISRQMLHASQLSFAHPVSTNPLTFEAPVPEDMQRLISNLRHSN